MPTSSIGYTCSVIAHLYLTRLQALLEHLDLRHWFFVLLTIDEGMGLLSQQQLADALSLDKVSITRAIDHLMERGYVERCACAGDRRKHLVKLTPKARPAVKAIRSAYGELNKGSLRGLRKSEQAVFLSQLSCVLANLREPTGGARVGLKRMRA